MTDRRNRKKMIRGQHWEKTWHCGELIILSIICLVKHGRRKGFSSVT